MHHQKGIKTFRTIVGRESMLAKVIAIALAGCGMDGDDIDESSLGTAEESLLDGDEAVRSTLGTTARVASGLDGVPLGPVFCQQTLSCRGGEVASTLTCRMARTSTPSRDIKCAPVMVAGDLIKVPDAPSRCMAALI